MNPQLPPPTLQRMHCKVLGPNPQGKTPAVNCPTETILNEATKTDGGDYRPVHSTACNANFGELQASDFNP